MQKYSEYKSSGIDWLGKIPKGWEVKLLKYEVTCNDNTLSEQTDENYEIQYIDISSVSLIYGITHKEHLLFNKAPSRARRRVKKGDVIVSTVRTYLKAITQINEKCDNLIVSTGFAVLRSKENINTHFLGFFIQSEFMIAKIMAYSKGVSYPAINVSDIMNLPLCIPPLTEQQKIADFLDKEIAKIDQTKQKTTALIAKLKEYRTALISNAVTGKIKVY